MAKNTKTYEECKEYFQSLFDTIGGTISEEADVEILNAILKYECPTELKIKFLVEYSRNLERDNHYANRRK